MSLKILDGPTIPAGKSMSDAVDCTGSSRVLRLVMPQDWTMAPLSIQLSVDGVNFNDLYNTQGPEYSVFPVTVSGVRARSSITLPVETGGSVAWLKLRSGTFAAPVNQTADRAFKVVLLMPDAVDGGGTGTAGPAGATGPAGPAGGTGPTGSAGSAGTPGTAGATGPAGATGSAGSPGATGPTGTVSRKGTVAGDDAAAGDVGEFLAVNNTTGLQLTTLVTANVTTLALPAGDWTVTGVVIFTPSGTGPNSLVAGISTVPATLPTDNQVLAGGTTMYQFWASGLTSGKVQTAPVGTCRINLTAQTNIYLVAQSSFGGGSVTVTGRITARRTR